MNKVKVFKVELWNIDSLNKEIDIFIDAHKDFYKVKSIDTKAAILTTAHYDIIVTIVLERY